MTRPHICQKYHKLYLWRKICHVEKFQISVNNLNNLWSFIKIYAVFVLNLCGEKSVWKKSLWRKNDKYEVCSQGPRGGSLGPRATLFSGLFRLFVAASPKMCLPMSFSCAERNKTWTLLASWLKHQGAMYVVGMLNDNLCRWICSQSSSLRICLLLEWHMFGMCQCQY